MRYSVHTLGLADSTKSADFQECDVARINRPAEQLNREAADVLEYQGLRVLNGSGENREGSSREDKQAMYIHMFAFRFRPGVAQEQKERVVPAIQKLQGEIPGVLETWVGWNESPRGNGYELGGVMKFADKAACDAYGAHPVHQKLLSWLMPLIEPAEVDFVYPERT